MAVNVNNVLSAIVVGLNASANVKSILGDPVRCYRYVPRNVSNNSFPFVSMQTIGMPYLTGVRKGPGVDWIAQIAISFTAWDKSTNLTNVSAAQQYIAEVMDAAPGLTVTDATITHSLPVNRWVNYDVDDDSATSFIEYVVHVEDATP